MTKFINKPLYKLERKANYLTLIIYTLVVGILLGGVIALYPIMKDALASMPEAINEIMKFGTPLEYLNMEGVELWVMLGAIYATWLAVKLTSGEFRNGSAELLYSLNMSRGEMLRTKLLRLIINVTIFNVVMALVSFFSLWIFCGEVAVVGVLVFTLFAWLVTLIVGFLMFGWGIMGKRHFNAFIGIIIVVLFYIIPSISLLAPSVEWLGFLSPFTALYGDVMTNGFAGLLNSGASIIIWGFVSIGTLIYSIISFKNVDLD